MSADASLIGIKTHGSGIVGDTPTHHWEADVAQWVPRATWRCIHCDTENPWSERVCRRCDIERV